MTRVDHDSAPSQDELERRAREGDAAAVDALVRTAQPVLVRFCYRYLGNLHEAEDVAQETLASLVACDEWPAGSLQAWLYRAARYRCLDHKKLRRSARVGRGALFSDSHLPSPRTGPPTAAVRRDEHETLRRQLTQLTEAHAEVLVLRYFEELGRKEIAEVLDLPESVVKSRLYEATQELRRRLEVEK